MKIAFFEEVLRFTPKGKKHYGPLTAGFLGDDVWREKSGDAFEIGELAKTRYTAIFALLVLLVVVTFFGKAFALQVVKGKDNLALSQGNSVQAVSLRAPRGLIYDRNGVLLAGNIPAFSVELNTEVCGREAALPINRSRNLKIRQNKRQLCIAAIIVKKSNCCLGAKPDQRRDFGT